MMMPAWIALGLVVLSMAALLYLYRRPLPRVDGTVQVSGLRAPVEIIRDRWGVPHIYAQNRDDLFFAQGYVHAQDRLWQMELHRRFGQGRLAEIFGEVAFTTDRMVHVVGLPRAAQADLACLDEETLRVLEAYAHGVNAFIEANRHRLPLEFTLLGLQPEPWQPLDSLAWGKLQAWWLSHSWDYKLLYAALIGKVGAERAAQLVGEYPVDNPVTLPGQTVARLVDRLVEEFRSAKTWLPTSALIGMSNAWVVDGARSVTGKPLLASDPHLSVQMPSIWYENHLIAPDLEVTGVSFPAAPGVIIGHNAEIAWGMTAAFADVQDLYIERLHPDDPTQYEHCGAWEKMTVVREEIRVKGEASPRVVEVFTTHHGPLLDQLVPTSEGRSGVAVALRWAGHQPSRLFRSVWRINQARNWAEFCEALRDWSVPSHSFVYADRAGNIGCYMPGLIPVRRRGMGSVPVPGWTDEPVPWTVVQDRLAVRPGHEWEGWIPHEELPHAFNPAQHFLVTANNQVAGVEYPHFLTLRTQNGFRARRIVELLTRKEKLSADDFAAAQVDQFCAPARTFCVLLTSLASEILRQPVLADVRDKAAQALDVIKGWDCSLTADSVAGAIYKVTEYFAMHRAFTPWLGDLTDHYLGRGFHPLLSSVILMSLEYTPLVLHRLLTRNEADWFKDADGAALTRPQVLALALKDAIVYLSQAMGEDISRWRWGKVHPVAFHHPLGARKPLDRIFNRGPYPLGGDSNTVWQAGFAPGFPIRPGSGFTTSWRQIIDLSDWDASRAVHATGQSGHPASKHYDDLIPLWRKGEYHPLLWARERVEAHAEARLWLRPPGETSEDRDVGARK